MPTVILDKTRPHVTVIRLNRPERRNAMSIDLCLELKSAFEGRQPVYTDEPRRGVYSSR